MFRKMNPNFFEHFKHNGKVWVPIHGKKAEMERRKKAIERGKKETERRRHAKKEIRERRIKR